MSGPHQFSTRKIEALFERTLEGQYDDERAWDAVNELQRSGNRLVFERAAGWAKSNDSKRRARAMDVLAQLGGSGVDAPFREDSYRTIVQMLALECDPQPIASAVTALGHLADADVVPLVLPHLEHPSRGVRFAVAFALSCFANVDSAIAGLLRLMTDFDDEIRDWATFRIGSQGNADTPEIREALVFRLNDEDEDVRAEAAVALAKRVDSRALPWILLALDQQEIHPLAVDAAKLLLQIGEPSSNQSPRSLAATLRSRFRVVA